MQLSILIPVKNFRNAKQRLTPVLGKADREALAELMFRDVLRQVVQIAGLGAAFVVTGDQKVSKIARAFGAEVIVEEAEKGETAAVEFACARLKSDGVNIVLIIPGDIPLVRAGDIEQLLAQLPPQAQASPFALLTPSHDRLGTNALLLSPPDVIKLGFGYDSFSYHLNQVATRGLPLRILENERIALDIDEPKDLERFLSFGGEGGEAYEAALRIMAAGEAEKSRRSG